MAYTLDTNILIDLKNHYPRTVFPTLWQELEEMVTLEEVCVCQVVAEELKRGYDDVIKWVSCLRGFIHSPNGEEITLAKEISEKHPGWVSDTANYADPFVIAHAKTETRAIVTNETRKGTGFLDKNAKIPNIADEIGVSCLTFLDFLKEKKLVF